MKKRIFPIFLTLILGVEMSYGQDQMSITIVPDAAALSEVRTFTNGTVAFANRTYVWQNVPSGFDNFQFLATDGNVVYYGKIKPSSNGTIYLLGPDAEIQGWTKTNNTVDYSSSPATTLCVYEKTVVADELIVMPTNSLWAGFTPLAKTITVQPADTGIDQMSVDIVPSNNMQTQEVRGFSNGVVSFTNRDYVWQSVPSDFAGFKFLANNVGTGTSGVYYGKIVPAQNGKIYILGPSTTVAGWTITTTTVEYTSTPTPGTLYIYQRSVSAGDSITIPTNQVLAGFTPLAKNITLRTITTNNSYLAPLQKYVKFEENKIKFTDEVMGSLKLFVFDISGKLVYQCIDAKKMNEISLNFLGKGIYLLKLDVNGKDIKQKIAIK